MELFGITTAGLESSAALALGMPVKRPRAGSVQWTWKFAVRIQGGVPDTRCRERAWLLSGLPDERL